MQRGKAVHVHMGKAGDARFLRSRSHLIVTHTHVATCTHMTHAPWHERMELTKPSQQATATILPSLLAAI